MPAIFLFLVKLAGSFFPLLIKPLIFFPYVIFWHPTMPLHWFIIISLVSSSSCGLQLLWTRFNLGLHLVSISNTVCSRSGGPVITCLSQNHQPIFSNHFCSVLVLAIFSKMPVSGFFNSLKERKIFWETPQKFVL